MTDEKIHIIRPFGFRWGMGQKVRKKSGAEWHGEVCGFYTTELNEEGYNVRSLRERNSVQLYPVAALEVWDGD